MGRDIFKCDQLGGERMPFEILKSKIEGKKAVVAFVGLGKMGLPSATQIADAGFKVVGIDVNPQTIASIQDGHSPYVEPGLEELLVRTKHCFSVTSDYAELAKADVVLCAVPTGVDEQKHVDYSIVRKASEGIGKYLKKQSLVIFESNVSPGTTENLVKNAIEDAQSLRHGKDYWLAYVPIQGKAGRMLEDLKKYPRIVAGLDGQARDLAAVFFKVLGNEVELASSVRVCELQKLFANIYKDINLAIANELAEYCEKQSIDVREVIRFVNQWPGIHLFDPDIGVGGNCLPVDPYFYLDHAYALRVPVRLPKVAREVNDERPKKIASKIVEFVKKQKAKSLVLYGAAFRPNTHETAYSPAIRIYELVRKQLSDTRVYLYDPVVGSQRLKELSISTLSEAEAKKADVKIILVEHDAFKEENIPQWRELL